MDYYRKAAAVFIVIISLTLPFFMEVEEKVAVININNLIEESRTLKSIAEAEKEQKTARKEIIKVVENAAAEYAENNHYSSVVNNYPFYKGGENITEELANEIDQKN